MNWHTMHTFFIAVLLTSFHSGGNSGACSPQTLRFAPRPPWLPRLALASKLRVCGVSEIWVFGQQPFLRKACNNLRSDLLTIICSAANQKLVSGRAYWQH